MLKLGLSVHVARLFDGLNDILHLWKGIRSRDEVLNEGVLDVCESGTIGSKHDIGLSACSYQGRETVLKVGGALVVIPVQSIYSPVEGSAGCKEIFRGIIWPLAKDGVAIVGGLVVVYNLDEVIVLGCSRCSTVEVDNGGHCWCWLVEL